MFLNSNNTGGFNDKSSKVAFIKAIKGGFNDNAGTGIF
jgi:hypothetical protein